jgi:hypothetical protein
MSTEESHRQWAQPPKKVAMWAAASKVVGVRLLQLQEVTLHYNML